MKKRILALVLVLAMALSFSACSKKEEAASGPITLVYAEVNPEDTIVGQVAADFKSKVEELSKGQIIIDVRYSGVLGSENDVLDAMLAGAGSADISRISAFSLTSYGAEKSVLLSLPYTFESRDHFWKFATSDLANEFLNESYDKKLGVKGLFYGTGKQQEELPVQRGRGS